MTAPKSPRQTDDTLTGTDIIPSDPESIQDPVTYTAVTDDLRENYQQQAEQNAKDLFISRESLSPQPLTGTIDVAKFLTAQAEYIKAQTVFMQSRRSNPEPPHPEEVLREVTRFSYAQADFIEAQNEVLKQLGVI